MWQPFELESEFLWLPKSFLFSLFFHYALEKTLHSIYKNPVFSKKKKYCILFRMYHPEGYKIFHM